VMIERGSGVEADVSLELASLMLPCWIKLKGVGS
jgi:hypothetical protein